MLVVKFIICVAIVVSFAILVSNKAEWFEENTPMKGIIVGILLAAATSLPELVSGLTAVFMDQPQMAAGSILGSNFFNCLIISITCLIFIQYKPNQQIQGNTNKINLFLIVIYLLFIVNYLLGLYMQTPWEKFSIVSILVVIVYGYSLYSFNKNDATPESTEHKEYADKNTIIKQVVISLALIAVLITASSQLANIAEEIMTVNNLDASLVGAILVGASTSLPEMVSAFSLMKNKKYDMAVSATLGSNLFNFLILAILDFAYYQNLVNKFSVSTNKLVIYGLLNSVILFCAFKYVKSDKKIVNALPFISIIGLYLIYLTVWN